MLKISIVTAVYKSSLSVEQLVTEISNLKEKSDYDIELTLVNDSPGFSETEKSLLKIEKQHSFIKVIRLRKNQGQHKALLVGIKYSKGDYIITMDDDLQHPTEEIPKLIEAISIFIMIWYVLLTILFHHIQ
jgi:glycosyltransferase involved in cell wall biosynthesis